jgi:hypothetical protein
LAEAADTEVATYNSRPTDPSFDLIEFTGGDLIGGGTGLIHAVTRADELY